jgi:hypothetical protein
MIKSRSRWADHEYRRLTWAGHVARILEGRHVFKILTGKSYR